MAADRGKEWSEGSRGFSLVELLVVMAIVGVLMALLIPAFSSLTAAKGVETAAYEVSGALEMARSHAMANNTYTWVGFYEEDETGPSQTVATPPYPGVGRLVLAIVASKDGTKIFDETSAPATLPADRLDPLIRVLKVENVHLADLGSPSGGDPKTLEGRPGMPYTSGSDPQLNRIASAHPEKTKFPFSLQNYTFHKTIRFSPRGEADINGGGELRTYGEIGLKPSRGAAVVADANVAAIQFTGVAGNVKIYRP